MDPVTLTPAERLILAGLHAGAIGEVLEEFMDTDGVLTDEGARHLWQKWYLASAGHGPLHQVQAMEKLWTRLGKLLYEGDPALPELDLDATLDRAYARAGSLWEALTAGCYTPAELCLSLAVLTGQVAQLLAAHAGPPAAVPAPNGEE